MLDGKIKLKRSANDVEEEGDEDEEEEEDEMEEDGEKEGGGGQVEQEAGVKQVAKNYMHHALF